MLWFINYINYDHGWHDQGWEHLPFEAKKSARAGKVRCCLGEMKGSGLQRFRSFRGGKKQLFKG